MDERTEPRGQEQTEKSDAAIIQIGNYPVIESAVEILTILGNRKKVILRSKGHNIPNAVAIANIITEKLLKGNSHVQKINLDTVSAAGIGDMTSTIEIILIKN